MSSMISALRRSLDALLSMGERGLAKAPLPFYWESTWYAPCDDRAEFSGREEVAADRLQIVPAPGNHSAHALRAEVRDFDQPAGIGGGWRAEVIGPTEPHAITLTRYRWSTMFDPAYPTNPVAADPAHPQDPPKPIWQVFFQWHQWAQQGNEDVGTSPPVAFIIEPGSGLQGKLYLHLNEPDPNNPAVSVEVAKIEVADLAPGAWHEFEVEIMWNMSKGSVRVFHDGIEKVPRRSAQTIFPKRANPNVPGANYMKAGLYRKGVQATDAGQPVGTPPNVGFVVYHDEIQRFERRIWYPWPPWRRFPFFQRRQP